MARKDPPFRNTFTTGAKSQKELRETLNAELQQRLAAKTILNPDEVAGEYDFSRLLFTTLGGQARPLTVEDLHSFRASAKALGNKYKGGIRPKQVIDASLKADRDRAHREIKQAIPVTYRGGRIQFQTNSGPYSDTTRHQLVVELLNYRKDGSTFWNALHLGPIYDSNGELTYLFGSQWDVSDVRAARAALASGSLWTTWRSSRGIVPSGPSAMSMVSESSTNGRQKPRAAANSSSVVMTSR